MKKFHASSSRMMLFLGATALLAPLFAHADTTYNGVPAKGTLVASGNFAFTSPPHAAVPLAISLSLHRRTLRCLALP